MRPHPLQALLKAAFLLGPLLMLASALAYRLGYGLIPPGKSSYIEGILGAYALALFVPIYLALASIIAQRNRIFGCIIAIVGLLGSVAGTALEYGRILEHSLRQHGASDALWSAFYAAPGTPLLTVALLGPLFPLASILIGLGLLHHPRIPTWACLGLILAGLLFPAAQILELPIGFRLLYPLAALLWAICLPIVGLRLFPSRDPLHATTTASASLPNTSLFGLSPAPRR